MCKQKRLHILNFLSVVVHFYFPALMIEDALHISFLMEADGQRNDVPDGELLYFLAQRVLYIVFELLCTRSAIAECQRVLKGDHVAHVGLGIGLARCQLLCILFFLSLSSQTYLSRLLQLIHRVTQHGAPVLLIDGDSLI